MGLHWFLSLITNAGPQPPPKTPPPTPHLWIHGNLLRAQVSTTSPVTSMDVFPLSAQRVLILSVFWVLYSSPHSPWVPPLYSPGTIPSPPGVICMWGHSCVPSWPHLPPQRPTVKVPTWGCPLRAELEILTTGIHLGCKI